MFYTDVRFVNTMLTKAQCNSSRWATLTISGFLEAEKGRELFNRYEFAAASETFAQLRPTLSASADLYGGMERSGAYAPSVGIVRAL